MKTLTIKDFIKIYFPDFVFNDSIDLLIKSIEQEPNKDRKKWTRNIKGVSQKYIIIDDDVNNNLFL